MGELGSPTNVLSSASMGEQEFSKLRMSVSVICCATRAVLAEMKGVP